MTTPSDHEIDKDKQAAGRTPPVTPDLPAEVRDHHPSAPAEERRAARGVHIAPDIMRRVTVPDVIDTEKRDLDALVHKVLIIGLALSTTLMLAGVALDIFLGRALPETVAALGEIFPRIVALRPSGLLTLGLLVLIATPILRVIGSIAAFVYERDWRFAAVTSVVLLVMMISIVLGKG